MIKYLGSKRLLIPKIVEVTSLIPGVTTVIDLFSGTSRVGHAFKKAGYQVLSNDHNAYAEVLARCYVQADAEDVVEDATKLIREFDQIKGSAGYFTDTYCIQSKFFQPHNGERIDAIREAIKVRGLEPELEAVVLTSLMEAADRVDSTVGLQMAYLKSWSKRSYNNLELRVPEVLPRSKHGKGRVYGLDVFEALPHLTGDVAYIDPPYNQHSYLGNYHIWETLVRWDKPEVYGVAQKRVDVKDRKSVFNSKPQFGPAFERLLQNVNAPILIVSFSDEGYLSREEIENRLFSLDGGNTKIYVLENDYPRYVGAKIGGYNPQGEKVGKVSHLRNKEFLYVVFRYRAKVEQMEELYYSE